VLDDLGTALASVSHIRTREYDDRLAVIEARIAPYALAFYYEIRRLTKRVVRANAERLRHR
jgi:hypothetical protein